MNLGALVERRPAHLVHLAVDLGARAAVFWSNSAVAASRFAARPFGELRAPIAIAASRSAMTRSSGLNSSWFEHDGQQQHEENDPEDRQIREHSTSASGQSSTGRRKSRRHKTSIYTTRRRRPEAGRTAGDLRASTHDRRVPTTRTPPDATRARRDAARPSTAGAASAAPSVADGDQEPAGGLRVVEQVHEIRRDVARRRTNAGREVLRVGPAAARDVAAYERPARPSQQRHRLDVDRAACTPLAAAISDAWPIRPKPGDVGAGVDGAAGSVRERLGGGAIQRAPSTRSPRPPRVAARGRT